MAQRIRKKLHFHRQARQAADAVFESGREDYQRGRMLVRLLPVGPDEIAGTEPQTTERLVLRLARAIRIERARGRAGHWTYDLNRHLGLMQALKAEQERLADFAREQRLRTVRT